MAGLINGLYGIPVLGILVQFIGYVVHIVPDISPLLLQAATPLALGALCGVICERSGVVNIGIEGTMLASAFVAWIVGVALAPLLPAEPSPIFGITPTLLIALVAALLTALLISLVHAWLSITVRADQIISGTIVNIAAFGITGYLFTDLYGARGIPPDVPTIPDVTIGGLKNVYFIGPVFGNLNLMIWLSFVVVVLSWVFMFKTPAGLRLRAVGEHPRAADTVGISVYLTRYLAVTTSGGLAAMGGAYLTLGFIHNFDQNITGGRGFIALAALIFGKWRPFGAFAAALLFGFSSALGDRLPSYFAAGSSVPQLFNILPYLLTLIAVAGVVGRSIPPAAIGRPYTKR